MLLVAIGVGLVAASGAHALVAEPSRAHGSTVAKLVVATTVRDSPGGPVVRRLQTSTAWSGAPQHLLVLSARTRADGGEWLRVRLPGRPSGSSGWIRRDTVLLRHVPWWVEVSIARRLVSVYRDGVLVRRMAAVVGAPATPTPRGLFSVYERVAQPRPHGFLGTWAIHLTAFSSVLDDYGGGPGRIALHGRGGASLRDPLGSARSHGCVRLQDRDAIWLARRLTPGTPVLIG